MTSRATKTPLLGWLAGVAAALLAASPAVRAAPPAASIPARPNPYADSRHGNPRTGILRDSRYPRGSCMQCHGGPSTQGRTRGERHPHGLFAAAGNDFCLRCHRQPLRSFPGPARYGESAHAGARAPLSTGPVRKRARLPQTMGACTNCHDPHGRADAQGIIPAMLVARGDDLCLSCHGASGPGPNVRSQLQKSATHPSTARQVSAVAARGLRGNLQVAGCTDCHNPHLARRDGGRIAAPNASARLTGAPRVRVTNNPGGTPLLEEVPLEELMGAREYEICFRCHAGPATASRAGRRFDPLGAMPTVAASVRAAAGALPTTDLAALFNPNNPSYHPVEAPGRSNIDSAAFTQGWSAGRQIYCADCHSSDGGEMLGPHGSRHDGLIKRRMPTTVTPERVLDTDLCFDCHAFPTYAQPGAGVASQGTRFGSHASHSARGYSCYACHDSHGSATMPALLVTRPLAMTAFTATPVGGTCTANCHSTTPRTVTYRARYPR